MKVTVRYGITGVVCCVLLPATTAAQHFPSDAELTSLIQTRVDDGRAIGIDLASQRVEDSVEHPVVDSRRVPEDRAGLLALRRDAGDPV
jgi:hypothetical protein